MSTPTFLNIIETTELAGGNVHSIEVVKGNHVQNWTMIETAAGDVVLVDLKGQHHTMSEFHPYEQIAVDAVSVWLEGN